MLMLCRSKVRDPDRWMKVFTSHAGAHRAAGLKLTHFWRSVDDANTVFFLFKVEDRTKAEAFINAPASAAAGKEAGVIDGDYRFIRPDKAY